MFASRPDLLNWSRYLSPTMSPEEMAEQVVIDRYVDMTHRFAISPTRQAAFDLMALAGYKVIPHALVRDTPPDWEEVVVYLTPRGGHAGRDKVRLPREEALRLYPDLLCSRYYEVAGMSFRELRVGFRLVSVRMRSAHDWRSNVGEVDVSAIYFYDTHLPPGVPRLLGPLWAIDYIITVNGEELALDLNTSPGLEGVDLGDSPADLIASWFRAF